MLVVLIAFAVIGAYPTPGDITEEKLREGVAKTELARWVKRVRSLGFDTDADRLGRVYVAFATAVNRGRDLILSPITPLLELTGTHQGWRLFAMPNERPHVLRVYGERKGKRRLLYETWSSERDFLKATIEFRRVRALYNPTSQGTPNTYEGFARRLSERVFEQKPELEAVTILLERRHTTLPGVPPDPKREERFVQRFTNEH